jgi:predicted ribosome quality control (RQC) complex YloA/Tae2 family protein
MTDNELIDYTLKFDTDPVRIRLAKIMDNMPGAILDSLEDAGMDPVWCTFENTYLPGEYIRHLENELEVYQDENQQLRKELEEQKARSIVDLIEELSREIKQADWLAAEARRERDQLQGDYDKMKSKLSMWAKLNADPKSNLL